MNPSQKISLVMATFNGQRFLREQLDSIYSQTLVPNEVIVVDDCSKDATVDILKEYSLKYGLKYFVNERHMIEPEYFRYYDDEADCYTFYINPEVVR